jgi:hypothetical protein
MLVDQEEKPCSEVCGYPVLELTISVSVDLVFRQWQDKAGLSASSDMGAQLISPHPPCSN